MTIICGVSIGAFVFIGAGSVVSKDVSSYALVVGMPAKQIGWIGDYDEKLVFPLIGNDKTIFKYNKQKYQLKRNEVIKID